MQLPQMRRKAQNNYFCKNNFVNNNRIKMKKIIITLALAAAAAFGANAQIGAGLGYATKVHGGDADLSLGGLYVGANYNYEIANGLAVAPGIDFAMYSTEKNNVKYKENYIGIPVLFNYGIEVADGFKLVPFAGPTFSLGLSSKSTSGSVTIDNYDANDDYGKFDILIGGGVALDVMEMIRVSIGYNYGLLDRNANGKLKDTCSGVHFGVAYLF